MSFLLPMWEWFIIYTTHFWWFGRWFIIVLPTLLYSHVYQWRGLVVSFCLLCNDPCWRSHHLSFHLSLLWLSLSLMLDMTRICRSHGKVWRISILGHRFWPHRFFFGSPEKEPNASDRGVPRLRDQSKNLQDQSLGWTSRGPKMLPMDAEGFITLRLGLALQSTTNGFCRSLWSGFHQHQIVAIPDIPDIPCFLRCSVLFLWQSNRAQDMMIPNDHCVVFFQHGEQLNGPKKLEAGWRCHWVNLGALVV